MAELKNYIYINRAFTEPFARQLNQPIDVEITDEGDISARISGVGGGKKRSSKAAPMPPYDPRLVTKVVEGLRKSGQLHTFRPTMLEFLRSRRRGWYVFESDLNATPVYLPLDKLPNNVPAPESLTVWVSDPARYCDSPEDKPDSFLIMAEEPYITRNAEASYISGWSALQVLGTLMPSKSGSLRGVADSRKDPTYGYNPDHPIDQLKQAGGTVLRERWIETLYKIVHVTEGKYLRLNGKRVWAEDVLAYPIYIAE
jgi:hypothetical protein